MLVPLSRKKFEDLIPLVGTGAQYKYYWGKLSDVLRRVLISISAVAGALLIRAFFATGELQDVVQAVTFFLIILALVYWLWSPAIQAAVRNAGYRRYKYAGFLRGEVLDVFVTDELVGTEESVNNRGELVVTENRERRINVVVGDETGFETRIQVPLKREHQAIRVGDTAEMLALSDRPDLGRIAKVSDIFVSRVGVWVSDYPYLRRDEFEAVSRQINTIEPEDDYREPPRSKRNERRWDEEYDEPRPRKRIPKSKRRSSDWD
ncbi:MULTISPECIES: phosphate ABC transporter permease [Leptolyngbya]|uniref:Phosphate ABC transporter permease n=1 Tax=Leptolyngbya boryana CZ1 TaxID=3060204 RepID=A0AA96X072_LEPBY|nr:MULTISPECIES: phosphate ABC transporter permease [Leptolyngbya]MCY6489997.1 phosphate ABC transporter permease [Leptolyngbya sp. GGD]WNZ47384.1 phosphate ABC transporter permease [Leptolyngbya boryana CZ1]